MPRGGRPQTDRTRVRQDVKRRPPASLQCVYMLDLMRSREPPLPDLLSWISDTGFDTLLLALPRYIGTADILSLAPIAEAAARSGLHVQLDLRLDIAGDAASVVRRHPDWYQAITRRAADPRDAPVPPGLHRLSLRAPDAVDTFVSHWVAALKGFSESGIGGYRCKPAAAVAPEIWRSLIAQAPEPRFSIWTPELAAADVQSLPHGCFGVTYSSLAWWDFGADWLRDEAVRLSLIAPVANTVGLPVACASATTSLAARRLLEVVAMNGHGHVLPMGFEFGLPSDLTYPRYGADDWQRLRDHVVVDLTANVRQSNHRVATRAPPTGAPCFLSSAEAPVAVLFEPPAQLTIANRHLGRSVMFDPTSVLPLLDGRLAGFTDAFASADGPDPLKPGTLLLAPAEVRVFTGAPARPIVPADPIMTPTPRGAKRKRDPEAACRLAAAAAAPRVTIEAIEPAIDGGRFIVKRVVGERVTVEADIFADGHGKIAAALQWRARDEVDWHETPMVLVQNDRWSGGFLLERVGGYLFRILAWPDRFATWRDELIKKHAVGLDLTLELQEGKLLLDNIAEAAQGPLDSVTLESLLAVTGAGKAGKARDLIALLSADATAARVARANTRPGRTVSGEMPVEADRRAAEFAAWYELFPRGQSGDPARHGTFRDVMRRLPAIRDMGFDVLYFPPIHPIGRSNRKGRDNMLLPSGLTAGTDNPGSPYAIGAAEGGHDAIHPELGTIDDFRALRDAAAAHGLELALDFAIQCSPDHPWLREHPEWFDWRPDGSLRYAENPPKKYEDIVNVDFYQPGAIPGLWAALRDVVAYWAAEGVRIFRVDNPHTKPFAFWEWLIADVRAEHPDTLFLAEAFTRPKTMYRLAKLGFSQSYTYFTWRDEKWEIEAYLKELTAQSPATTPAEKSELVDARRRTNVADFFRPNFFVNTPDISPIFLQHSGRAGFLIRAALAATLSGLWGMLQGFEFCEAKSLPGREEYADSDKYQIRVRPDRAPADIVDEITRLNAIRRANPALQSHRGLAFHHSGNDRVLWYRKANVDRSNVVLVAVSLDPFAPLSSDIEVPLWEWGLGDDAALTVTDLMSGGDAVWIGKYLTITLDPGTSPFRLWRARPLEIS